MLLTDSPEAKERPQQLKTIFIFIIMQETKTT